MSDSDFKTARLVLKKVLAKPVQEGNGAVLRGIGSELEHCLDPFVTLFHFTVTPPGGFPDHPHRGFEAVTYMLQGAINYQDFAGNKGTIRTGDVQWITAGRGIVHSEMPAGEGTHTGLQLWINLSSKQKMIEPRYKEVLSEEIPRIRTEGAEIRVLAGESLGVKSPHHTKTPLLVLDMTVNPRSEVHQRIPEAAWNCFAYVIEGEGVFGSEWSEPMGVHHVAVFGGGEGVSVWNKSSELSLRVLVVAGKPLEEGVKRSGPFVMNSENEIDASLEDYRLFKNGFEMAKCWKSRELLFFGSNG